MKLESGIIYTGDLILLFFPLYTSHLRLNLRMSNDLIVICRRV
jgi:hypothetical protein